VGEEQPSPGTERADDPGDATHVVTCFLLRRDRGRDEVLLVRRSDRVRTYRGRWAGVSGYVEPGVDPQTQAYVELREETGLTPEEVTLVRSGAPLPVHDREAALRWVVHPFLFLVSAPDRVHIDWEARELRWVATGDIAEFDTVPGLAEALGRVYPADIPTSPEGPRREPHD
jgi:8-oxo-dGTP diphosphatase